MLKILMVSAEATPYAKTGGLGDVVGALPAALHQLGHQVAVVLPRYAEVDTHGARRVYDWLPIWLAGVRYDSVIYRIDGPVSFYFVDCAPLYDRSGLYGTADGDYPDNHIRFAVLCRAALEIARRLYRPHILHCHDWQAAVVPTLIQHAFATDPTFIGIKTLFTIHNLGYQGLFPRTALAQIGLSDRLFHPGALEFYGQVNLLKGGLLYADALNTVSKGYAREIQTPEFGFGLDGLLRARSAVLSGIVNGVDYDQWSPEADRYIVSNYSVDDLRGKVDCKLDLIHEFGLPEPAMERPLFGIVSRLAAQKGADLIAQIAGWLVTQDVSLVVLGSGDAVFEDQFRDMALLYPDHIGVRIGYDNALAHKIEAGADMFLMPSRYEPCGLNQIYSLRYGTVPVVRATGGLDDTIDEGTGFKFADFSTEALMGAIREACAAFSDRAGWQAMMRRGMQRDFSWNASASEYAALYERLASQSLVA